MLGLAIVGVALMALATALAITEGDATYLLLGMVFAVPAIGISAPTLIDRIRKRRGTTGNQPGA